MKNLSFIFFAFLFSVNIFSQTPFPESGQVFRNDVVPKINIIIPADSLEAILAPGNEESNYHYHATFIFDNGEIIDTLEDVGFRLRGNTSRYSEKKSFKISFNTYEPGRKWYGLEKLNINGEHNDPSIARSKIGWDLMREIGVPASRSNHVELYFNNQYIGVFINVEHIDEEFVQLRFGNNDGNLFKCLWPADLQYKGSNPNLYKEAPFGRRTYSLKTNTAEDDYSDIANFIDVLNNTPIGNLPCELEKVFNVDNYLKAVVVDVLTANWDGPIYNKNNFYLYHNLSTNQFEYIPYDLDNTLGIDWFNVDWAERNIYEWSHPTEFRPIYDRLMDVPEYRDRYSFYFNRFLEDIYNENNLTSYIENIKTTLAPLVENDVLYPLDYGFDIDDFNDSYESGLAYQHTPIGIKEFIADRFSSAQQQLQINNVAPIITELKTNKPNALQDISFSAKIIDDVVVNNVVVCYSVNGQSQICESMYDDGQQADGLAGDNVYGFILPSIGNNATVKYYILASDDEGVSARQPICDFNEILIGDSNVPLVINEFMASNDNAFADEFGEYDDWVEIYSLSDVPIYLGNYFLSDNEGTPDKWPLPDVSIQPGEYLILWADGDEGQGDFHADFKLSASGEFIGLFDSSVNDFALIDGYDFDEQSTDVSMARIPNGTGPFVANNPTPGAFNDPMTNVFEEEKCFELNVSPNPFSNEINIVSNEIIVAVEIYGEKGQLVFEKSQINNKEARLNIDLPNAGVYFLKIKYSDNTGVSRKVVFQK